MNISYIRPFLLLSILPLLSSQVRAQSFEWVAQTGNNQYEDPRTVTVDTAGNVISVGYYSGVLDADPSAGVTNLSSNGGYDIFIQKLNPSGQFMWAQGIGGNGTR